MGYRDGDPVVPENARVRDMRYMDIDLPKWPALVVMGNPVTREEAQEILVRTGGTWFLTNDRRFGRELHEAMGIECDEHGHPKWEYQELAAQRYGVLELSYLTNHRVVSSWIGGPHGWCDWGGKITSSNYNIGKWPEVPDVLREWALIAAAFPFLTLRSFLFDGETCEEGTTPVVEYRVEQGEVELRLPDLAEPITQPESVSDGAMLAVLTVGAVRERGCTIDQFKDALAVTERRLKGGAA